MTPRQLLHDVLQALGIPGLPLHVGCHPGFQLYSSLLWIRLEEFDLPHQQGCVDHSGTQPLELEVHMPAVICRAEVDVCPRPANKLATNVSVNTSSATSSDASPPPLPPPDGHLRDTTPEACARSATTTRLFQLRRPSSHFDKSLRVSSKLLTCFAVRCAVPSQVPQTSFSGFMMLLIKFPTHVSAISLSRDKYELIDEPIEVFCVQTCALIRALVYRYEINDLWWTRKLIDTFILKLLKLFA
mgnify:CR=1 FL=1